MIYADADRTRRAVTSLFSMPSVVGEPAKIDSVFDRADRVRDSLAQTDPERELGHMLMDGSSLKAFISSTADGGCVSLEADATARTE